MQRILLLITDLEIGGTPTVVRELAIRLKQGGGADVQVACLAKWGPVADELIRAGIAVTALGAGSTLGFPAVVWKLARLVREQNISAVFSFLLHANAVAAAVAKFCPAVRWLQSIQTTQPTPAWHWRVQSIAHQAAERIVVPSPSVAAAARDWADVPAEKIAVIPNAVDLADFDPARRSSVSNALPRIGFIGRLDPIKRIPDLVEAMEHLDCPAHLDIFGEGSERAVIERTIAGLHLADRVTLHGSVARPQDALARIDVLALPSQAEGFGLVLIEAMAAGVPVVATDVAGIRDVVRNGENGLLVPVASPPALAAAIASLLKDQGLRRRLVEKARADVRERFSWEVALPAYQKILGISAKAAQNR